MTEHEVFKSPASAFESETFGKDGSFHLDKPVGSASISPCGRDVVLASRQGLHIIDLDSPYSPPRHLAHNTPWEVADVQWSPFAARDYWVVSTSNQKALVWNLTANSNSSVEHVLHAHTRAITDINFSAHNPDILATCAVDSFVHCWDLRHPSRPAMTFCDWFAAATQVKWNRQDSHILASSHDKVLRIWDDRKGAYPLRSIEAHATKIYGVDWSRTETTSLVTCSLDRTIKFWDYTGDVDEPTYTLRTPFPVWRARHTPFGSGLLAMPQRGDYDLHLYHRLQAKENQEEQMTSAVHRFGGHNNQVKEFLWRPRGSVTENNDDREFQLVSWGTDRILRLHEVGEDVLDLVGYQKGMTVERRLNFTRRNASYKTFREDPSLLSQNDQGDFLNGLLGRDRHVPAGIRSVPTAGMSMASAPFVGGYANRGFMSPLLGGQSSATKDMDPISWMRGVKIRKHQPSPTGAHQSVSSVLSSSLNADPKWDNFESLGEEIAHMGDKFTKVSFDEVDMQRRKITIALTGPWSNDSNPTCVRTCIEFPISYPHASAPIISMERTTNLDHEIVNKVNAEVSEITAAFLSRQRNSLEAILRYLLGEQTLEESLFWLKKCLENDELDTVSGLEFSSSDEDEEISGSHANPKTNDMESSDPMIAKMKVQNNVPLPKLCGALWMDNGRLVCFFPSKQEKEFSLLDLNHGSVERSSKSRKSIFEAFGRFHNASIRKKQAPSTLETIESDDFDSPGSSQSSSSSSSGTDDIGIPHHHFMPNIAWHGDGLEAFPSITLDESQKSSNGVEKVGLSPREGSFITIHDYSEMLSARKHLAQRYVLGGGSHGCSHSAQVAQEAGEKDLADIWSLVDLLVQGKIPLEALDDSQHSNSGQAMDTLAIAPVRVVAHQTLSRLRVEDIGRDLTYDASDEQCLLASQVPVRWSYHPLARQYLVDAIFQHYEQSGDLQMLAMLSCAFTKPWDAVDEQFPIAPGKIEPVLHRSSNDNRADQPSEVAAKAHLWDVAAVPPRNSNEAALNSENNSMSSLFGTSFSDHSASTTPPSTYRLRQGSFERRESFTTSFSSSPARLRQAYRSSPNLTAFSSPMARPAKISPSVASSPPNSFLRKHPSPVGSYAGGYTSTNAWNPSQFFSRSSSTLTEDPKASLTLSFSETEEDGPVATEKPVFVTRLKHQEHFHDDDDDGDSDTTLLNPNHRSQYSVYRDLYARMLFTWALPIAKAELLKYNETPRLGSDSPDVHASSVPTADEVSFVNKDCLGIKDHCQECNTLLLSEPPQHRCQECQATARSLICLLCNTFIHGLSSPCLNCGHVLHHSCQALLLSQSAEDVAVECISGCGCVCGDHMNIDIESPHQVAWFEQADVNAAVTVKGDVAAKVQEQSGWYDGTEWEDMAYESLSRNLRPRQEVKAKSGRNWKGRKQST